MAVCIQQQTISPAQPDLWLSPHSATEGEGNPCANPCAALSSSEHTLRTLISQQAFRQQTKGLKKLMQPGGCEDVFPRRNYLLEGIVFSVVNTAAWDFGGDTQVEGTAQNTWSILLLVGRGPAEMLTVCSISRGTLVTSSLLQILNSVGYMAQSSHSIHAKQHGGHLGKGLCQAKFWGRPPSLVLEEMHLIQTHLPAPVN